MLRPPVARDLVPENFPLIGHLPVHRPISDHHTPRDPLLGYLPPCSLVSNYVPAVWGSKAYSNSFDKFTCEYDPKGFDSAAYEFAKERTLEHFNYMRGSCIIPITATQKPIHTTCAFPKSAVWKSEEEFLRDRGWPPYVAASRAINYDKPIIWYLFLKKEILKKEKVGKGDIRQILCADPIFSRIGLMFDQHQNARLKQYTQVHPSQVGWTPMYGGFQQRVRRLQSATNPVWCEMDWTRFDGSIHANLFRLIRNMRWSYIDEKFRTAEMRALYEWYVDNLIHRYVLLPSGEVTYQDRGNPSGQVSTSVDNCMINYFLQMYEYYHFFGPDTSGWDALIYGDDRLSKLPREISKPDLIDMYKKAFGMVVKEENIKFSTSPSGLSFCGFSIGENLTPIVQRPDKLLASLMTPIARLPDVSALCGKVMSLWLLLVTLPESHPVRRYVETAYGVLRERFPTLIPNVSVDLAKRLWRGGPKERYG